MKVDRSVLLYRVLLSAMLLLVITVGAQAQTYCVRSGATGANNGSDWNNAYTTLPATLQRGATYYVADGSYGNYTFDDPASGTSVITVKKAIPSDHGSNTGWQDAYGDGFAQWDYWVIITPYYTLDGQVRNADWRTGYGFRIVDTATRAIDIYWGASSVAHHINIRYLEIVGRGLDNSAYDCAIYAPWQINNVTVSYCYFHDFGSTVFTTGFANGWTCEYSVLSRNSSDPAMHAEGWASTVDSNFIIRHNVWEDIEGTGFIVCLNRGQGVATCDNWQIYGNVFMYTEGNPYNREGTGNGCIAVINQQIATNWKIYNNSFVNLNYGLSSRISFGSDGQSGSANIQVYNNFWWRSRAADHTFMGTTGSETRYNRYDATSHTSEADQQVNTTASTSTFVNYATKDFRLTSGTMAGTSLASPYNVDMKALTRGSDGVWDRGAYEYSSGPDTMAPVISTIMTASIGSSTAVITWNTDENATSVVDYGTTTSYGSSVNNSSLLTLHSMNLSGLTAGTLYHYRVRSTDAAGNASSSGDFTFTTTTPDLVPPTVSVSSPANGSAVSNTITISATASDIGSGVASVAFLVDGANVGTATTSPYTASFNTWGVANGSRSIQARATDAAGNQTTSSTVTVNVQNSGTPPANGEIAHWSFDEASGTVALDTSGSGNDGSLFNGTLRATGRFGKALQFDGVDDYMRVPTSSSLRVTNGLSISVWVKLNAGGPWQTIAARPVLEGANTYPFSDYGLAAVDSGGSFSARFNVTIAGNFNYVDAPGISYGAWHHLVAVYNGSAVTIYVDGAQAATLAVSGTVQFSNQALFLARNGSGGDRLNGLIDETRIYRKALSFSEIQSLYNTQLFSGPSNLRVDP